MRPEGTPLDLNNLPDEFCRDGKQIFEDASSTGYRKRRSGAKDGKDESGKVYECRFCSLKFCKSQALGGHMNRHRQERETETLNRARQLILTSDNFASHGVSQFGYYPSGHIDDPTLCRSMYTPRLYQPPGPPYLYPSPPANDYYAGPGRVIGSQHHNQNHNHNHNHNPNSNPNLRAFDYVAAHGGEGLESGYTCVGAPVGFTPGSSRGDNMGMDHVGTRPTRE